MKLTSKGMDNYEQSFWSWECATGNGAAFEPNFSRVLGRVFVLRHANEWWLVPGETLISIPVKNSAPEV